MNERVSIIMPVYNSEKYLKEAIESILSQTYKNFKLIIINDGSTDNSVDIIKEYAENDNRIKYYDNNGNKGLPYTRRRALELCNTEYIALMDSDDISYKTRIEEQVRYLDKNSEVSVVTSNFDYLINNKIIKVRKNSFNRKLEEENIMIDYKLMFFNPIVNSASMFRKEFIEKNKINYRKEYFIAQDYMFWVQCKEKGKFHKINKTLMAYRTGHENITKKSSETKKNERKKLIDTIRIEAISNNRFDLSENDIYIFNKVFSDPYIEVRKQDFELVFDVINKMINQIEDENKKKILVKVAKYELVKRLRASDMKFLEKLNIVLKKLVREQYSITTMCILRLIK